MMRRLILLFVTFTYLYTMGQVNEQTSAGFEFPFKIGDVQWKSYSTAKDRIEALQIPEDKLKNLTTTDLLNVCLDFPYSMDMLAFDSPEVGFNAVCKEFNGYRELLTRKDLADALLQKCDAIPDDIASILDKDELAQGDYSFKCYILFYMMGIDEFTSSLDAEQSAEFTAAIREATTKMKAYPNIFGISYSMGKKRTIKTKASVLDPFMRDTKILTPNGYEVTVGVYTREDMSPAEKESKRRDVENEHPNVIFLSEATNKYNCHAYAWYIQSLPINGYVYLPSDKLVHMYHPSTYWLTGCYYEVPENEATVVCYKNDHSAIRLNSNEYISKWGNLPLVKHSPTDVWYIYGAPERYYKLYDPQITGPSSIISNATYAIDPLPSGYTVTWSLSDSYYAQSHMTVDDAGRCTITRDSYQSMENATLTATIMRDQYIAKILTKTISAHTSYSDFYVSYNWNSGTTHQLVYPYIIYIEGTNYGSTLNISSPYLKGATITYEGDITPTRWNVDKHSGTINVGIPSSTVGQAIVINVGCTTGDEYRIVVLKRSSYDGLSIIMEEEQLNISLVVDGTGIVAKEKTSMGNHDFSQEPEWTLDVYDAVTNRMVYSDKVIGTEASVSTSGWTPGIYVVRATLGDKTFSEKILIK